MYVDTEWRWRIRQVERKAQNHRRSRNKWMLPEEEEKKLKRMKLELPLRQVIKDTVKGLLVVTAIAFVFSLILFALQTVFWYRVFDLYGSYPSYSTVLLQ